MTITDTRWHSYWADKSTPEYPKENVEHYQEYAAELSLLFPEPGNLRVLEIGCGNGSLYQHLGFDTSRRYLGVDFSRSMLDAFASSFPQVDLVHADGASFRTEEVFDLVFSSQVVQYWSHRQLGRHLTLARSMLRPGGSIVLSGIPWSRMRIGYARGDLTGGRRRSLPVTVLAAAHEMIRPDIGTWFDYPEIDEIASRHGFQVSYRGSLHYPYRFHAVLRRANETESREPQDRSTASMLRTHPTASYEEGVTPAWVVGR